MEELNQYSASCKVCGIVGAQIHYGAMCCTSCKMFFRRNIRFDLTSHQCVFNEICDITINSRRACRYCRLQKCLDIGMQRELIRASHCRPHKNQMKSIPLTKSIEHRSNNHSVLTDDQWCRLSNVINIYENKSPVLTIRHLLSTQSQQPIKIRLKKDKTIFFSILTSLYQSILPFIETIPEYQTMQVYDQHELIRRNLSYIGGFNAIPIFRNANVLMSTAFTHGFPSIYGSNFSEDCIRVAHRLDNDLTLIKLFLPVILFSTTCYVNLPNNTSGISQSSSINMNSIFLNTSRLYYIQNIYIEILFKYMILRFGYNEASIRFAALLKTFMDQSVYILQAEEVQQHDELIQTVVQEKVFPIILNYSYCARSILQFLNIDLNTIKRNYFSISEFFDSFSCRFSSYLLLSVHNTLYWSYALKAIFRFTRVIYPEHIRFYQITTYLYILIPIQFLLGFLSTLPIWIGFDAIYLLANEPYCTAPFNELATFIYIPIVAFLFPLLIISVCYLCIIWKIRHTATIINVHRSRNRRDLIVIHRIIIIIAILSMVSLPLIIDLIIFLPKGYIDPNMNSIGWVSSSINAVILAISTPFVNPKIYQLFKRCNNANTHV
ncbi:hypothetical protein I4U23_001302 [Adineta vaga]|nr:hypothetical protein I4U23_001302 [Adineta vaga]